MFTHVVGDGKEVEGEYKEKEWEANLIIMDHHQNPMSTCIPPKDPTS